MATSIITNACKICNIDFFNSHMSADQLHRNNANTCMAAVNVPFVNKIKITLT